MNRGIIYYNIGRSHLVRLLVSLYSLRRFYNGPVTILSEGDDSFGICLNIAEALDAEVTKWNCGVPAGENRRFLAKTRYHIGSPYEITIALDADTVVLGPIDQLFCEAELAPFCVAQFADWTTHHRLISKRLRAWQGLRPDDIAPAIGFGPAINCGVVTFRNNSTFCRDWLHLSLPGRETFIPDEVCCQLSLHRYPHRILDQKWNRSCKYDDPEKPDTRIVHYHGNKHCRLGLPFHGRLWMREFEGAYAQNLAKVQEWCPAGDFTLTRFLRPPIGFRGAGIVVN